MRRRDLLKAMAAGSLVACGGNGDLLNPVAPAPVSPEENPGGGAVTPSEEFTANLPEPGFESAGFDFPMVLAMPFAHGVASGDPLADRVILWTRLTLPEYPSKGVLVRWLVSTTPDMQNVIKSGTQRVVAKHDYTLKVDAQGLQAATTYYYQFKTGPHSSIVGRTRTAPADMVSAIRLAVVSCSSYWSSTWSGYGAIAQREDLDLVIHCGDYIYDFVDEDEQVRARRNIEDTAYVDYRDWLNLDECRRRYALFRSDPQLMAAHQQHPWFITWDNHDIDPGFGNELPTTLPEGVTSSCTLEDTTQAFWEWTPSRPVKADGSGEFIFYPDTVYPEPADPRLVYRSLSYGPLASIRALDTQSYLPGYGLQADASHLPAGTPSLFGKKQFDWLLTQLRQDQADGVVWKVLNNQTWIAPWVVPNVVGSPVMPLPVRWSDYNAERNLLISQLRGGGSVPAVDGTVFVSGDMHGNWISDVVEDAQTALTNSYQVAPPLPNARGGTSPENIAAGFQRAASANLPGLNVRAASAAVEFAPSSMGRGGADELVANALPGSPFAVHVAASRAVEAATMLGNKHVQFMEWVEHGYGIVQLEQDKAIFECWWQNKLQENAPDVLGVQMVSFSSDEPMRLPTPRFKNQVDAVVLHSMPVAPSRSDRVAPLAPMPTQVLAR
ncbi:MAG TPA: alkaline phosphatase D family protein [Limnobacter sp.]|nr:alkaline phosphatase D family protein [Limnobacter sp.]